MKPYATVGELHKALTGVLLIAPTSVSVLDEERLKALTDDLIASVAFGGEDVCTHAAWALRAAAVDLGAYPASIQSLYMARGRGEWTGATVPAINARFGYPQLRAGLRAAADLNVGAVIWEIARSEQGYTQTRPLEYAAGVYAAAIREGWRGPLFIQGDHYQVNAKRFATEPEAELQDIEALIKESVEAGFYNIDIDSSTIVDLSQPTVDAQQRPNYEAAVRLAASVRAAQPPGVVISLGGEIGEVGGRNSTVEELTAYVDGFARLAAAAKVAPGPSKISVQTGSSHGGVVLPDGSIAKVSLDFAVLGEMSKVAREGYGMAGAVQHGASTLPEDYFNRFPAIETAEIHLATGYQNMLYDSPNFPADLLGEMNRYIIEKWGGAAAAGRTDAQVIYQERKRAIGPFKQQLWGLEESTAAKLRAEWGAVFSKHFRLLNVVNTRDLVEKTVPRVDTPVGAR